MPSQPGMPAMPAPGQYPSPTQLSQTAGAYPAPGQPLADQGPKQPKAGDFDAGAQARFPNGPDAMGTYKTWNWVAADVKGRYFLLPTVTANFNMPLAIIHPDTITKPIDGGGMSTLSPKLFGGMSARLEATLPKLPKMPFIKNDIDLGLSLAVSYMHDGAVLLSEKDYPLFTGDFHPGFNGALIMKVKLSDLFDFSLLPAWVWQKEGDGSLTAFQMPSALIIKLGNALKLSIDLSIYTGNNYTFGADGGGRLGTGAALDLKIGPILAHLGGGFASLLTSDVGPYPTISDSVYFDFNVKYAK
ncbi:MAG TPA: hypothetical protein VH165_17590 [Kofleriaceae bacterium]|nr:hypothetical protein [Kofleriaceae bacterium]